MNGIETRAATLSQHKSSARARLYPRLSLMTAAVHAGPSQVTEGPHRLLLTKVRCAAPEHPHRGVLCLVHAGVMETRRLERARAIVVFQRDRRRV